jgi:hypothetical protein
MKDTACHEENLFRISVYYGYDLKSEIDLLCGEVQNPLRSDDSRPRWRGGPEKS